MHAMGVDRFRLILDKNVSFHKSLGTGKGETFAPGDADPLRWGLLASVGDVEAFDDSFVVKRWRGISTREFRAVLDPISSHGRWAGEEPFVAAVKGWEGQVVSITRARIKWNHCLRLWGSVPPVAVALKSARGLVSAIGIGEAPLGFQGTFSLWESASAIKEFAYKGVAHRKAMADTAAYQWYAEELFARFAVRELRGSIA